MLRDITLGQYYPRESVIHRLDPRVKIAATFLYLIMIFVVRDFTGYAFVTCVLAAVTAVSHVPVKFMARGMKPVMFIIVFTFVINIFVYKGTVLVSLGPLNITDNGLRQAVFIAVRLILLIFGTSLLTYTTKPMQLTDGFESIMRPFTKVGLPAHEIAMMMSIALRFIPVLRIVVIFIGMESVVFVHDKHSFDHISQEPRRAAASGFAAVPLFFFLATL